MVKFKKKSITYFVLCVFLLILLSSSIPALRAALLNVLKYPLHFLTLLRREARGMIFYHRNLVKSEILKKEIDLLKQKLNSMDEVSLENARLKELLSFKDKSPFKVVAARVIARSPDNWSSLIIIDKGGYNGIKKGMVVINHLGLVGRVIETTESNAKIMLINDTNFAVSCIVKRSRQEGLASGILGNSLMMKYLSAEADIKPSDTILTSGLTDLYPKGLVIGSVVEIGEEFSGLARYAVIKPAVELSSIEEVLVIVR